MSTPIYSHCVDCRHFHRNSWIGKSGFDHVTLFCRREFTNPVTGGLTGVYTPAAEARSKYCGITAIGFKPKSDAAPTSPV